MEDFVITIPTRDQNFMEILAARMGWKLRPRRASIEQFIKSCPQTPVMTDEEIAAEVNAVRYGNDYTDFVSMLSTTDRIIY